MATRASRKARARATEKAVAEALRRVFPDAVAVASALSGSDILSTPGIAVEVKARRDLNLTEWLRQASRNAGVETPVVIHRPDGFGPATVLDWPVTMTLEHFMALLEEAGYASE